MKVGIARWAPVYLATKTPNLQPSPIGSLFMACFIFATALLALPGIPPLVYLYFYDAELCLADSFIC